MMATGMMRNRGDLGNLTEDPTGDPTLQTMIQNNIRLVVFIDMLSHMNKD